MKSPMFNSLMVAVFCSLLSVPLARAEDSPLAKCLADSTTGKDRKDLARWVFVAMASHPEIKALANTSDKTIDDSSKVMGSLVERLLTVNCATEMRAIPKAQAPQAMGSAFEMLGRLAMTEIMADKSVNATMSQFQRYVDEKKIQQVMAGQ